MNPIPRLVAQINWPTWVPTERAVLCFIRDKNRVMLINKKTGLGAGKVNAPGGRIELGETPVQAAVRETMEEIHLEPLNPQKQGELFFQFTNGFALHGTVFFANAYTGTPCATPEADPFWCSIAELPFDRMWEDDRHWLPRALSGEYFEGYFIFEDDLMLDKRVIFSPVSNLH